MGGQADAMARLAHLVRDRGAGPIGINIGANKDSVDRIADYVNGVRNMERFADYLTINISSPNTPGLRALQDKAALDDLLAQSMDARTLGKPVFLKVAPDLQPADIDDIVQVAIARGIAALIVSNTTISRPDLRSSHRDESGGLSGAPLRDLAQQRLVDFRKASGGQIPLIGVGGIASAADAYARIRAPQNPKTPLSLKSINKRSGWSRASVSANTGSSCAGAVYTFRSLASSALIAYSKRSNAISAYRARDRAFIIVFA